MGVTAFVGRVAFAFVFLSSALSKLNSFGNDGGPAVSYMQPHTARVRSRVHAYTQLPVASMPSDVSLLRVAIGLELGGALLFVLNSALGARLLVRSCAAPRRATHGWRATRLVHQTRVVWPSGRGPRDVTSRVTASRHQVSHALASVHFRRYAHHARLLGGGRARVG